MSDNKIAILESKIEVLEREKGELINVLKKIAIMDSDNENELNETVSEVERLLNYYNIDYKGE